MNPELLTAMMELKVEVIIIITIFSVLRTIGLTVGFIPFLWSIGQTVLLRTAIGVAIGFPILVVNFFNIITFVETASLLSIVIIGIKELVLGFALGFACSLPFFAISYGGSIIDSFRGETDSGLQDQAGSGPISTHALLFLIISFYLFASGGGFWMLFTLHYSSFIYWPMMAFLPLSGVDGIQLIASILTKLLGLSLLVAGPTLVLLMLSDFCAGFLGTVGKKYNLGQSLNLYKALISTLALAPSAILLGRFYQSVESEIFDGWLMIESAMR